MNNLLMVFVHGFIFLGKPGPTGLGSHSLHDAVKLDMIYVPSPQGIALITPMRKLGNITVDLSSCASAPLNDSNIYADYVKLTTGIDIPNGGKLN